MFLGFLGSHIFSVIIEYVIYTKEQNLGFTYSRAKFQNLYGFAPFLQSMAFSFNRLPLVYVSNGIQFDADISKFK